MHLVRLELQGFKTFAHKTTVIFSGPKLGDHALTVIVGPNGSGKSNIADAIRWCLGEQSMKMIRGASAQDVIFSGAHGHGRAGFAEVSMTFDNADRAFPVAFTEVAITRRLYRDGESEYLMNGQLVRLVDIQGLLAEAGVGQRSYAVIGQGMVDQILNASPAERKIFFDDATGVRSLQMKRRQALLKLQKSAENLADVDMVLRELEPRLVMLRKQVERFQDRERFIVELQVASVQYFGQQWWTLVKEKNVLDERRREIVQCILLKKQEYQAGDMRLAALALPQDTDGASAVSMQGLQDVYKKHQQQLTEARRRQFFAEQEEELARVRAKTTWAPLPLLDIVTELQAISVAHVDLLTRMRDTAQAGNWTQILTEIENISLRTRKLCERLTQPNLEDFIPSAQMLEGIAQAREEVRICEVAVEEIEEAIRSKSQQTIAATNEIFTVQREVRVLQQEISQWESQENMLTRDIVRLETRLEGLQKDMEDAIPTLVPAILAQEPEKNHVALDVLREHMMQLRRQVALIGEVDENVVQEFRDTEQRFGFLSTQIHDLRQAIDTTEKVIEELDEQIHDQTNIAFKKIATAFQKYFVLLFGGGTCSLVQVTERNSEEGGVAEHDFAHHAGVEPLMTFSKRAWTSKDAVVGIEIQATPPGKRLKALNLLSGGERALTSIALICAIMTTNPAPFVVLDEVDAALDEANTVRFANILQELRRLTQCIVVTHNRATMEKASVLYGVTMGDDGVSKLLSVRLEDYASGSTARR